jgi:hypothetical protein
MSTPRVSILLPAYNRATVISRAIHSARVQTMSDWEMLVVDDASQDDTIASVEAMADSRIRVLRHEVNRGPSAARQTALEAARGEWVALLDSDDEWLPEKLTLQLAADAAMVTCDYFVQRGGEEWAFAHPPVEDWIEHLHFRCMLGAGTTLLVRRDAAVAAGGFDPALRYCEDWDFVLRLIERERLTVLPEPLARIHSGPPRSAVAAEPSVRRFLAKHDAMLRRIGPAHRRQVRGQHLQNLSAGAFAARRFALGSRWLIEAFLACPTQNLPRLAALALAPIDALCGTSLIERAAAWRRGPEAVRPAP